MSAARNWPEGVPPLLHEHVPDHFLVFGLLFARAKDRARYWKQSASYYDPRAAVKAADKAPRIIPRVVVSRRHNSIIYANAAARALGIVPDEEMESEA